MQVELSENEIAYLTILIRSEKVLGEWSIALYEKLENLRMSTCKGVLASHALQNELREADNK